MNDDANELNQLAARNAVLVIEIDALKEQLTRLRSMNTMLYKDRDELRLKLHQYIDAERDVAVARMEAGDDERDAGDEDDSETLLAIEGMNDCIVGVGRRCSKPDVLVYSHAMLVASYIKHGMTETEAYEWVEFNIVGAWLGEQTPMVIYPSTEG
jgi:regulator of replication initiation timing